ncbi:MAG: polymorphic toxin-type HINT domain-containing protein [Pirellula sp.]
MNLDHNASQRRRYCRCRVASSCGWIAHHKIIAGKLLPMNIEELQVEGFALVTSIDDCPEIAGGEGSIVTATFNTREVNTIARAEIIGPDGTIETIKGTPIHPIWSVDRNDWVPLGELTEGETLQAADGIATVLSLALVTSSLPVYNIEVHGEHVYQVGELGLLVHNTCPTTPVSGLGNIGSHLPIASGDALNHGIKWLGAGYNEIAPDVFRSADGLRQFRMTAADLLGSHGKVGPHVHIEALDKFGKVIENLHLPIF